MELFKFLESKLNTVSAWILKGEKRYYKLIALSSLFCIAFGASVSLLKNVPYTFSVAISANDALINNLRFVTVEMVQSAWVQAYYSIVFSIIAVCMLLACVTIALNILSIKFEKKNGVMPKEYMLSLFCKVEDRFL